MGQKRHKLKNLTIEELSVCRKGVNQKADILITKAEGASMKQNPVEQFTKALRGLLNLAVTGKDEQGNVVKSEEEQVELLNKGITELGTALNTEVEPPVHKGGKMDLDFDDDDDEDEVMKKAERIAKAALEAADERIAKAEEVSARMSTELEKLQKAQARRDLEQQVEAVAKSLPINLTEVVDVMQGLNKAEQDKFLGVLKSAESVAQTALLTSTIGKGQAARTDADAQLEALAKARAKEQSISFAKAYTDVCTENPTLYAEIQRAHGLSR